MLLPSQVSEALLAGLRRLAARHPDTVGDARGLGLCLGIEVRRAVNSLSKSCHTPGKSLSKACEKPVKSLGLHGQRAPGWRGPRLALGVLSLEDAALPAGAPQIIRDAATKRHAPVTAR